MGAGGGGGGGAKEVGGGWEGAGVALQSKEKYFRSSCVSQALDVAWPICDTMQGISFESRSVPTLSTHQQIHCL